MSGEELDRKTLDEKQRRKKQQLGAAGLRLMNEVKQASEEVQHHIYPVRDGETES